MGVIVITVMIVVLQPRAGGRRWIPAAMALVREDGGGASGHVGRQQ